MRINKSKTDYTYSDFDLAFNVHPVKKDLTISKDVDAILKSLKNLILTNHYERPFQPYLGSNVNKMLFEIADVTTNQMIKKEIETVIINFEPRVSIDYVEVYNTEDAIVANISMYVLNYREPVIINIPISNRN